MFTSPAAVSIMPPFVLQLGPTATREWRSRYRHRRFLAWRRRSGLALKLIKQMKRIARHPCVQYHEDGLHVTAPAPRRIAPQPHPYVPTATASRPRLYLSPAKIQLVCDFTEYAALDWARAAPY